MKIFRKIATIAVLISLSSFSASNIENRVAQIRKDFMSTNAAKNYAIREADDSDRSTEGGIVKYYSQNGIVKKIVVEHYGESWNGLTEYYIKNGKVYFIFDKTEKYNVPYYLNADWYKRENIKVGEVFDSRKSKIYEKRYYFDENMKLIRHVGENKKIVENVQKLKEIEKKVLAEYFRIKNKN